MQDVPVGVWLDRLADRTPAPGGGAAAALAAATSAALVAMVTSYTTGGKWADREPRMRELNAEAAKLRARALELADEDERAFGEVASAYRLPRATEEERSGRREAIQRALAVAAGPPVRTGQLAARIVEIAAELVDSGNPNVISDVGVAAATAWAAVQAAITNVEINRVQLHDQGAARELSGAVAELSGAVATAEAVVRRVKEKIG